MTLTLDPKFPLLWRTPTSLQLGLDNPAVVLTEVSTAQERMLTALQIGLTPQGLALIGAESGLSALQVAEFEHAIRPALIPHHRAISVRVDVDGSGPTVDRLELRLREVGIQVSRVGAAQRDAANSESERPADFAVIVGDYVLSPERRGYWLRRDIPHLPIVFGDTSVTIGPFIESGMGPCLFCLELYRRDADPLWPVLASQLLGRPNPTQQPFIASEVATLATRMVLQRFHDGAASCATAVVMAVETGERRERPRFLHPECACTGLPAGRELESAIKPFIALSA